MALTGSDEFRSAVAYVNQLPAGVPTSTQLQLYAAYKCVTVGYKPADPRPSFFDMTRRAKWDAWDNLSKTLSQEVDPTRTAEQMYIQQARNLGWSETDLSPRKAVGASFDGRTDPSSSGLGVSVSVPELARPSAEESVHGFAIKGDTLGLQLLLDGHQPLVNARDEFGYTPLHLAADRGHVDIVHLLLNRGADLTLKDQDGDTALEIANVAKHEPIIRLLQEHNRGNG